MHRVKTPLPAGEHWWGGRASEGVRLPLDGSAPVAPVLTKGKLEGAIELPPGRWLDDRGEEHVGPVTVTMEAPLERLIWMRRS